MRPDQRVRLATVSERLAEVVIADADPENWSANGKALVDMTKGERGDANWCRKTAVQSVALLVRVEQLLGQTEAQRQRSGDTEADTEAEIKRAEQAASALLDRVRERSHAGL